MPATIETRVRILEEKGAQMEERLRGRIETVDERLRQINRSLDRVIPHGEAIIEIRGVVNGALDDIRELREDIAGLSRAVDANELKRDGEARQRREDRRSDRRLLLVGFTTVIGALIAAAGGIAAALV